MNNEQKPQVGFIGIGRMGSLMVANLLKADFPVTIYDLNPLALEEPEKAGATVSRSIREVVERSAIVCSSLPGPPDVEVVYLGGDGILSAARPGEIVIDFSSILPETARKVGVKAQEVGVEFLEAPVSGGTVGAKEATLTIMVGGKAEIMEKARPVLEVIGENIFHMGEYGNGNLAKTINNFMAASNSAAMMEGFALGMKGGLDPELLYKVINVSSGSSRSLGAIQRIMRRDFTPGFTVSLMHKDLEIVTSVANSMHHPFLLGNIVKQYYQAGLAAGLGGSDTSSLMTLLEKFFGIEIRKPEE
ncbi:MAG: NAD(P)-dependent oxidoreductase [Candidatus Tectomicrobia bacterium]|nr:NAD(P)-dependent oxidoreductase [Candidatus Tectomicrobia bacterium]